MPENTKPPFFSVIVPAHNEEGYITSTLSHVKSLDYPSDRFEVLVIENGSTDATLAEARKFEGGNIRIASISAKGVSRAKNFGMNIVSAGSDWTIFLDADTVLEKGFLNELSAFLSQNSAKNFSIGTTEVEPLENRAWYARLWFKMYNWGHRTLQTSYAIQIMRSSLRTKIKFDEELALAEDLKFIKDALPYGPFFYLETRSVATSTRRFEKVGWNFLFIKWNFDALMFKWFGKTPEYPVIR